jgi:hypothetical protein
MFARQDPTRRAADRPLTIAEAAWINFEPWQEDGECDPPTDAVWAQMLITVRVAWRVMFKSKRGLMKGIANEEDAFADAIRAIGDAKDTLKALTELLEAAEMRLLASAAVHCLAMS